jgi:1,4-alpha-glucan branching enzyme
LNTDAGCYAGSGIGNAGRVDATAQESHGRPFSLILDLPPLGALVLKPFPPVSSVDQEVIEAEAVQEAGSVEGHRDAGGSTDTTR